MKMEQIENCDENFSPKYQLRLEWLNEQKAYTFLKYVYLAEFTPCELTFETIIQMLKTAVHYDMIELCELCCKFVCGSSFDKFDAESTLQLFFMDLPENQKIRMKEKAMKAFKA